MTAENPADAVIEQAARAITACIGPDRKWADCTPLLFARALHDAGLLADPADQDEPTELDRFIGAISDPLYLQGYLQGYQNGYKHAEAERDEIQAVITDAGLETYTPDGSERVAAHLTEQQRIITGLRAQVAAVQALADEWEDDGPGCQLWPAYRRLRAALDTAGGEQHE